MYVNHSRTLINGSVQISRVFVNLVRVIVVSGVHEFNCIVHSRKSGLEDNHKAVFTVTFCSSPVLDDGHIC